MTAALMLQGTGSHVGKSLIVAGLSRAYTRRGLAVRPFKPQNMSNNAAVTADGGEIGRAQALQAAACRVPPTVHMNPVLLKPETNSGAQVIVHGRRRATLDARSYMRERAKFLPEILESFQGLAAEADLVIVEGAGSPAEINLRTGDIANMGFAHAADVPVVLIGDVHRGGVIASIVGTFAVIPPEDALRIRAFLVNTFHGDVGLFEDAVRFIEQRIDRPCAGTVTHFADAQKLPAEDVLALEGAAASGRGRVKIAVPRFARIANFDDLDPLKLEPDVTLVIVQSGRSIPADANLVILPGSKSTIGDLNACRAEGWDIDLLAYARRGGNILGLCGGFQMLGRAVRDPDGVEGAPGTAPGLGLLDLETTLTGSKTLKNVEGLHVNSGARLAGYEMHLGRTTGPDLSRPFATLGGRPEGAVSADGRIAGTYLHGIFAADEFRRAYLSRLAGAPASGMSYHAVVEATLDKLADHLERHLDLDLLLTIANEGRARR